MEINIIAVVVRAAVEEVLKGLFKCLYIINSYSYVINLNIFSYDYDDDHDFRIHTPIN